MREKAIRGIASRIGLLAAALIFALPSAYLECAEKNKSDAGSQAPEREALETVIERFVSAWNGGDTESLASLFSPDGQLVNPWGSVTQTRPQIKQVIDKERSTRLEGTTLRKKVERINFVGTDSAVLIGRYAISGVHLLLGLRTSFEGPFLFRFRKQENGWAIVKADVSRSLKDSLKKTDLTSAEREARR